VALGKKMFKNISDIFKDQIIIMLRYDFTIFKFCFQL